MPQFFYLLIMSKEIGAVILAAGYSTRFGSSKLLAKLDNGHTVFQQTLKNISAVIPEILIVSRADIAPSLSKYSNDIIVFEQAELGMGASLSFAVKQIENWAGCLVCLGDMPFIQPETYRQIASQLNNNKIIIPTYDSKAGNPVAFGNNYFSQLKSLQGDTGGKSIINNNAESVSRITIDDPGILQDIDTPDDLSRLSK
ncbi:MAG: hypothetical protein COA96_16085 [SAR86 cluster bacterium]|uniref:MobA-like NTP transferase domain-containing protein n=1 Tax=SAR86 cluster bacterium TaxID=2030880 RepID=A0A2A5AL20_9GAMM|nr:MAG: hypothetical protein COA96_16085 [SAR86 cluster bacterium]